MKRKTTKHRTLLSLLPVVVIASACESLKSAHPLSPSVAGPLPGVNISAPTPLEPNGATVPVDKQPVILMIENASTSGPRPLSYAFEIATDVSFTNKVFARDAVAPGDGGRTTFRLPDALESGRAYYWRARAEDGANTGPFSAPANFSVITPVVIEEPTLVAPVNNPKIDTLHPTFIIRNAPRSGPVGPITYVIEVSDTDSFANKLAIWTVAEQPNQTSLNAPADAAYNTQYFWRARAYDQTTTGPWSATQAFRSPDAPVALPPPPTVGGPPVGNWETCGSTPGDALVRCVHAAINPARTVAGAFEVTKRVAWLLRGQGAGLLIKNSGENIISWQGRSFSAARICYPDGHIYKVLSDVPSTNGPSWQDNDFVDRSLYLPAIDPSRP